MRSDLNLRGLRKNKSVLYGDFVVPYGDLEAIMTTLELIMEGREHINCTMFAL